MIQEILVLVLVLAAATFIGKKVVDTFRHKKTEGSCAKCEPTAEKKIV